MLRKTLVSSKPGEDSVEAELPRQAKNKRSLKHGAGSLLKKRRKIKVSELLMPIIHNLQGGPLVQIFKKSQTEAGAMMMLKMSKKARTQDLAEMTMKICNLL